MRALSAKNFDMARLRTRLLLDQPFFGTLAMHLRMVENSGVETAATNGVELQFNPAYFASLTENESLGVLAHEVLHCGLLHPYRRGGRDLKGWNIACDHAVNLQLRDAGFTLPAGALVDPQYAGMSAEAIYAKRRAQEQQTPPEPPTPSPEQDESDPSDEADSGDGDGDSEAGVGDQEEREGEGESESVMPGCPTGEFTDGPETAEAEGDLTEEDWEVIAEEAATVAERAGDLPGGIGRAVKATREPRVDWKAETRGFLVNTIETDHSWATPNRRLISNGWYFPGALKENVGPLVVGVDTSGSVTQTMLDEFAAELTGLLKEARPERLHVVYCDARVNGTAEFTPDDAEVKLTVHGGGGTAFQPVFDWIEENDIQPLGLVYLTDLQGPAPEMPRYPVLWVTPGYSFAEAPFGQHVRMY